jgi:DNA-binding CsgD family transcriptional regulator
VSSAEPMRTPVVAAGSAGRAEERPTPADVLEAARILLGLVRRLHSGDSLSGVLLDVVDGGARCVITHGTAVPVGTNGHSPEPARAGGGLTSREREVARMVADGFTNKEIASVLEISSWTVSTHLRRIFGKLDVGTRAAMVARLVQSPPRDRR